jgi:hypothetical protein
MNYPIGDWDETRKMATTTKELGFIVVKLDDWIEKGQLAERRNLHESLFKSWHILKEVKSLLERGTAPDVVLHILKHLEKS